MMPRLKLDDTGIHTKNKISADSRVAKTERFIIKTYYNDKP